MTKARIPDKSIRCRDTCTIVTADTGRRPTMRSSTEILPDSGIKAIRYNAYEAQGEIENMQPWRRNIGKFILTRGKDTITEKDCSIIPGEAYSTQYRLLKLI